MLKATVTVAAFTASWIATIGGTWKLFESVEKATSNDTKQSVAAWLRRTRPSESLVRLSAIFSGAFDLVFGPQLLSFKTFLKSLKL